MAGDKVRKQFGALVHRTSAAGALEILLITSRETGRWVIPKGWPMRARLPHRVAAREALEEAGAVGKVEKRPIGAYGYRKRLGEGLSVPCRVAVFPMSLKRLEDEWPEAGQRSRRWFSPSDAADLVEEDELAAILRGFEAS